MPTHVDDDILEEHRDLVEEAEDDTELVRKLRSQLKGASRRARDRDTLAEENRTLKTSGLIAAAGLSDLDEVKRETLSEWAAKQTDINADGLHDRAVALGWAEAKPDPADAEIEEQRQIAAAVKGVTGGGKAEITPEQASEWDPKRQREFRTAHPAEWARLLKGETVTGITF